jgi:ribose transport system ATP-binding protein
MAEKILEMISVHKEFPGVKALDDVHLNIYKKKVMALLGENGAGKSTLMKILSGVYQRTEGKILYKGKEVEFKNPKEAQKNGIAIIHQELNLVSELSIGENIFLGREPRKFGNVIDRNKLYEDAEALLNQLNISDNPRKKIKNLSIGKKQMVEIAKALSLDAEVIIMDEPTDALTDTETESLFKIIERLIEKDKSIVYISHRLKEIFQICDYVTVLRDGQFISENPVKEIDEDKLIEMMVGRKLEEQYPYLERRFGDALLKVKKISNDYVRDVSFELKSGEILGVAGLMGAGRTELAKSIYGSLKIDKGTVYLEHHAVKIRSEHDALSCGIAYVSEDRKKDGLVLGLNVRENISLSALNEISKYQIINKSREKKEAEFYVDKMSIKTPSLRQRVKNLSGGNQQKVSIAKTLLTKPKVLILDEPTRGVDVGAKKEIYDLINEFKSQGIGIILISSEIPEILGICDRVMVMHEGAVSGFLDRKEADQEKIMRLAVGIREEVR